MSPKKIQSSRLHARFTGGDPLTWWVYPVLQSKTCDRLEVEGVPRDQRTTIYPGDGGDPPILGAHTPIQPLKRLIPVSRGLIVRQNVDGDEEAYGLVQSLVGFDQPIVAQLSIQGMKAPSYLLLD
jgi:hypothetical protein